MFLDLFFVVVILTRTAQSLTLKVNLTKSWSSFVADVDVLLTSKTSVVPDVVTSAS